MNPNQKSKLTKLIKKGKYWYDLKEYDKAMTFFEEGLKWDSNNLQLHYYLGLIYTKKNNFGKAIGHFHEILVSEKKAIILKHVYKILGYIYTQQEDYEQAREYLNQFIEIKEIKEIKENKNNNEEIISMLGYISYKEKDYEKAKEYYQDLLKLDENNANAYNTLGIIHIEQDSLEEGIRLCQKALKIKPESAIYLDSVGWGYYKKKDELKAIKYLKQAFEREPDKIEIKNHLKEMLNPDLQKK